MAIDRRRGLKRLATAVGLPWFGWWALYGWIGYENHKSAESNWWKAENVSDYRMMKIYGDAQTNASDMMFSAFLWGIVVPIVILIAGAVAYWVYRGFHARAHENGDWPKSPEWGGH